MSIWKRYDTHGLPSLITTNLANRKPLLASSYAARMLMEVINEVRAETAFNLLAFVVMPDHLHMVVSLPSGLKLGRVMQLIKGRFSNRYHRATGGDGNLWQERYHERTLRTEQQLITAIEYVHGNPMKAGIVSQLEDFPWSSANPTHDTDLRRYLGSG